MAAPLLDRRSANDSTPDARWPFGSDFPFGPKIVIPLGLKSCNKELAQSDLQAITHGSALRSTMDSLTSAQGAEAPVHDKPASAQSLPADNLPPFGMLGADGKLIPAPPIPAAAMHRRLGSAPETTARGPSLIQAIAAARGAIQACKRAGYRVGATVIDSAGESRAVLTMAQTAATFSSRCEGVDCIA